MNKEAGESRNADGETGTRLGEIGVSEATMSALVTLLQQESKPENLALIRAELAAIGERALPRLDSAAAAEDVDAGDRASAMARRIRLDRLDADWSQWALEPEVDLEQGVVLVDRFGDPSLPPEALSRRLDDLAGAVSDRLRQPRGGADAATTFSRVLFVEMGFRGNSEWYDDPENSYLTRVLQRRLGIPVSLSVVALLVAKRLELPITGVGMPGHFLVRYGQDPAGPYLDAFGGGRLLTRDECATWLRASGLRFDPRMLRPVGARYIVARMLRNLIATFSNRDESEASAFLQTQLRRVVTRPPGDLFSGRHEDSEAGRQSRPR